jgi:2-dehydropantoate 2-reductase
MNPSIKTVLVIGSGAKGGYIASRLHEKGVKVTVMARPERRAMITLRGLHVESLNGRFRRPMPTVAPAEVSGRFDLIIAACRSHLLFDALDKALARMVIGVPVLSLADGGPHLQALRQRYILRPVIEGICEARTVVDADGCIRHRPPAARIRLRPDRHYAGLVADVAQLFTGRGLVAAVAEDFDQATWTRSIFLAASVGAMAITGRPLRDTLRLNTGHIHFYHMVGEGLDIAARSGVHISPRMVAEYVRGLSFEGEPIASPPSVGSPGSAGAEALYLLAQMIERAEQHNCRPSSLVRALEVADRSSELAEALG